MLNDVKTHHVYQLCDRVASMMNNVVAVKTDQIREILAKKSLIICMRFTGKIT